MAHLNRGVDVYEYADLAKIVYGVLALVWFPFAIVFVVLFWRRRHIWPIAGRRSWLVVAGMVGFLVFLAVVTLEAVGGAGLPCALHRPMTVISAPGVLLTSLLLVALRVFCLYFTFEITSIKSQTANDLEFSSHPKVQWFISRRAWITTPYLAAFAGMGAVLHGVLTAWVLLAESTSKCGLVGPGATLSSEAYDYSSVSTINSVGIFLYTATAVFFAFRYRHFQEDAFLIRNEIGSTGWAALLGIGSWGLLSQLKATQDFDRDEFPVAPLFSWFVLMSIHYLQIVQPVLRSFKPIPVRVRRSSSRNGGTRSVHQRSTDLLSSEESEPPAERLEQLLKHKEVCVKFQAYLEKEFSGENLAFWSKVEEFKDTVDAGKIRHAFVLAQKIEAAFLTEGALLEINISFKCRSRSIRALARVDRALADGLTVEPSFSAAPGGAGRPSSATGTVGLGPSRSVSSAPTAHGDDVDLELQQLQPAAQPDAAAGADVSPAESDAEFDGGALDPPSPSARVHDSVRAALRKVFDWPIHDVVNMLSRDAFLRFSQTPQFLQLQQDSRAVAQWADELLVAATPAVRT